MPRKNEPGEASSGAEAGKEQSWGKKTVGDLASGGRKENGEQHVEGAPGSVPGSHLGTHWCAPVGAAAPPRRDRPGALGSHPA